MVSCRNKTTLIVGLFQIAGILLVHLEIARSEEPDLLQQIRKSLPAGWSVDLSSRDGNCCVHIITEPIDTRTSKYGNGAWGTESNKQRLDVGIKLLPCYTREMLAAINSHNEPIEKQLKLLGRQKYSDRQSELESQLIEVPVFYDKKYGLSVIYPSIVPAHPEDKARLMNLLERITKDWKSYDGKKPKVLDELRRILME